MRLDFGKLLKVLAPIGCQKDHSERMYNLKENIMLVLNRESCRNISLAVTKV